MNPPVRRLDVYRTAIPMRVFEHAAASRQVAEAVVTRLELADGRAGWGETLPRPYVTGETLDGVVESIRAVLWPAVAAWTAAPDRPLPELPSRDGAGRPILAAVCAVELALLEALCAGDDPAAELARLLGAGSIRRTIPARVSGVLGSADPARTARGLRLMRWFGLRDFKLKLGLGEDVDRENLRLVCARLGPALRRGRCSLRVDVNGAWDAASTPQRVADLARLGICAVEQPVSAPAAALADLAGRCDLPLLADESLLTWDDAQVLRAAAKPLWWNLRISKNGGLAASLNLARLAEKHSVPFTLGCMVGESAILSAAQRRLLQLSPAPRFVEGNYGRFLLRGDLARRSPRFGYGGRLGVLPGAGWGAVIDPRQMQRFGRLVLGLTADR